MRTGRSAAPIAHRMGAGAIAGTIVGASLLGVTSSPAEARSAHATQAAPSAITKVSTIAFTDVDGPKVKAIVVKYDRPLKAGAVGKGTYKVFSYANLPIVYDVASSNGGPTTGPAANEPYSAYPTFAKKHGTPGAATKVYVSSTPTIDPTGQGDASGRYVIIQLNTRYQLAATVAAWRAGVAGGVEQKKSVRLADGTRVSASSTVVGNYKPTYNYDISPFGDSHSATYQEVFNDKRYTLKDVAGYKIHTNDVEAAHTGTAPNGKVVDYPASTRLAMVAGHAFHATKAFSEYDGKTHDVRLKYSLYVPRNYDPRKKYMLVLHIEDAGGLGDDPMISLTESQAAANYASRRVQRIAKAQGYGGVIVAIPQIPKSGQSVADNLTGNEYLPATWKLMDHLTSKYNIAKNRIYGSGQSMGGMQVLDMAAQRDNYFAGIWAIGSQWGNNYDKSAPFHGSTTYTTYPTDGKIITNRNWQNWYYSVSDDNILATNMTGDATATGYWNETRGIYSTMGHATIPYAKWSPVTTSVKKQNKKLTALLRKHNKLGIYWAALSGGDHKSTWIYAHRLSAAYDWLLHQKRSTEEARGKLPLAASYPQGTQGYSSTSLSIATGP